MKKNRRVLNDTLITAKSKMVVDWNSLSSSNFATTGYDTDMAYDGLNRVRSITYPNDKANERKTAVPKYNRGGALQSMKFNNTDYIKEIAYNARGQRILMASGSLMQRYAYQHPLTFRLEKTKAYAQSLPPPAPYHPQLPSTPLNGPTTSPVIQPP